MLVIDYNYLILVINKNIMSKNLTSKNTLTKRIWSKPRYSFLPWVETNGKRRVRDFEGGNNPNNPCLTGNPNLNRCFRRGPS